MKTERPTSISMLIFLFFLIGGTVGVAAMGLTGSFAWFAGMILGFAFGLFAAIEFQIDKERRAGQSND